MFSCQLCTWSGSDPGKYIFSSLEKRLSWREIKGKKLMRKVCNYVMNLKEKYIFQTGVPKLTEQVDYKTFRDHLKNAHKKELKMFMCDLCSFETHRFKFYRQHKTEEHGTQFEQIGTIEEEQSQNDAIEVGVKKLLEDGSAFAIKYEEDDYDSKEFCRNGEESLIAGMLIVKVRRLFVR